MRIGSFEEWKKWAHEGRIGWATVLLLFAGAGWLYAASPTQSTVRLTGFFYELIGIVVVFIEIAKASGRNKLTPLHKRMAAYLHRVPLMPQERNVVLAGATAILSLGGMRAQATVGLPPGSPLEKRVDVLERNVKDLDDRIEAVDGRVEAEERARAAAIAAERSARESAVSTLDGKIRDVEIGGLDLSLFGVFFLFAGMVLTTATPEVCWLLSCR